MTPGMKNQSEYNEAIKKVFGRVVRHFFCFGCVSIVFATIFNLQESILNFSERFKLDLIAYPLRKVSCRALRSVPASVSTTSFRA